MNLSKQSKITAKYQITIPKEVRKRLKLQVADVIQWQSGEDGRIYVTAAQMPFLKYEGILDTGPGDPVEDVKQARRNIGRLTP